MITKLIGLFGGDKFNLIVTCAIVVFVIINCLLLYFMFKERDRLNEELAKVNLINDQLKANLESSRSSNRDNWAAFKDTESRNIASQEYRQQSEKQIEAMKNENDEICRWSSGPIPDDVWQWLCDDIKQNMPGTSAPDAASDLPKGDPGTNPPGKGQPSPGEVRQKP
jgi:uncharacterized protein HemX